MRNRYITSKLFLAASALLLWASCSEVLDNDWVPSTQPRSLSISKNSLVFQDKAGSQTVDVTSENLPWEFINNANWLEFSPAQGSSSATVTAKVDANESDTARTSFVKLTSKDSSLPYSYDLTVKQSAPAPYITLSDSVLIFSGTASQTTVKVESNREWTATKSESWLTVTRDGDNQLHINATANEEQGAREGFVNISAGGLNAQIRVTQRVANVTSTIQVLQFGNDSDKKTLDITAESKWRADCSQSWLNISTMDGEAGTTKMTVSVLDNLDKTERTGFVYIYVGSSKKLEIEVKQTGTTLYAKQSSLTFTSSAGSEVISIAANTQWSLETSATWIKLNKNSGSGNADVTVTVEENSQSERTGFVKLKDKNGNEVSRVDIIQHGIALTVTPTELTFGIKGNEKEIYLKGNIKWKAKTTDAWISLDKTSGEGDATILVTVPDNPSTTSRIGNVSITDNVDKILYNVRVRQTTTSIVVSPSELTFSPMGSSNEILIEAADVWLLTCPDWVTLSHTNGSNDAKVTVTAQKNESSVERTGRISVQNSVGVEIQSVTLTQPAVSFATDPNEIQFAVAGGNNSLAVTSNVSWTASSSEKWVSISPMSGQGDAVVTISANENKASSARTAEFLFRRSDGIELNNVTVRQAGASVSATPSEISFTVGGGSENLYISANSSWTLSSDSWLSLSSKSGSGNATVAVTVGENTSSSVRTGKITLKNGNGETVQTISVAQNGTAISATPTSIDFAVEGGTNQISISANSSWNLSTSADWFTLSEKSGKSSASIRITAQANNKSASRSAAIQLKNASNETVQTINVTQAGTSISVTPGSLSFGVAGGAKDLKVSGNSAWSMSCVDNWLTLSSKQGSGNATVTITASENTSSESRTSSIVIKNTAGETLQTISISQDALSLYASPNSFAFSIQGETKGINVKSNGSWSVVAPSWITLSPSQGNGDATIQATAAQNNTSAPRSGSISLRNSVGQTFQEILVSQDAYSLQVTPEAISCSESATSKPLTITANADWKVETSASWISLGRTTGTGNANVTVSIQANATDSERKSEIVVTCGNVKKSIPVTQGYKVVLKSSPSSLSYPVGGSSQVLTITSNTSWVLEENVSWLSLDKTSGSGNATVNVTATANPDKSVRSANIALKNSAKETVQTISVTQTALSASLSLGKSSFDYAGGTTKLNVTANVGWKLSAPDWIKLSSASGSGNATIDVTVNGLSSHTGRGGDIVLNNLSGNQLTSAHIEQSGMPETKEYERDLSHTFPSNGGSLNVSSFESGNWTAEVTSGSAWITLAPKTGSSGTALTITTSVNKSGKERRGEIVVTYGFTKYKCAVIQSGMTIKVSPSSTISFYAKGGESSAITVTADKVPTITTSASWFKVKQDGMVFTIIADTNTSSAREGKVTISLAGIANLDPVEIIVKQGGVDGTFGFSGYGSDEEWDDM